MANFTPQEIEEFLQEFFDVVGARQYVGARYVPIFGRKGETSIDWDGGANPYAPLTIVLYQGNSYTSRQYVPAGVDIGDTLFWALTGNYNGQVEHYREEVLAYAERMKASPFVFSDTVAMSQYDGLEVGDICKTLGYYSSDDGGAAWYVITNDTPNNMDVIACGSVSATMLMLDNTICVNAVGAHGDGITNDFPYISRALALAESQTIEIVQNVTLPYNVVNVSFNRGVYITNSSIVVPAFVGLSGCGTNATCIRAGSSIDDAVLQIGGVMVDNFYQTLNAYFRDLWIDAAFLAKSGLSNETLATWINSYEFSNLLITRTLQTGIFASSCFSSTFNKIVIDCCCVGAYFGPNSTGSGFNNNIVNSLNVHNASLMGLLMMGTNSIINALNIDRLGSYNKSTVKPSSALINSTTYTDKCGILVTGNAYTCKMQTIWMEWIGGTDTDYACVIVRDIAKYGNNQFKASSVKFDDLYIGTAVHDVYKIKSGIVEIENIKCDINDITLIDTTNADANTQLFVKGISRFQYDNQCNVTLPYGAFKAELRAPNGAVFGYQGGLAHLQLYDNGKDAFDRSVDTANGSEYVRYIFGNVTEKLLDNGTHAYSKHIISRYGNQADESGWFDLGIEPASGSVAITANVTARNAAAITGVSTPHYMQFSTNQAGNLAVRMTQSNNQSVPLDADGNYYFTLEIGI